MKKIIFGILLLSSLNASAGDGDPVVDKVLFDALHEHYNGVFKLEMPGQASSETLRDQSILVELSDRFAEFAFYNLPQAKEEFLYIPPTSGGWLNYFDRTGTSIKCGESSYDLKNNPFPAFKCRFTIDAQGNVLSFSDRSALTSNAKPGGFDGWENGTRDFHWRTISERQGSAYAYSNGDLRRDSGGKTSFAVQIFDKVADLVYSNLDVKAETVLFEGDLISTKYAKQIWCYQLNGKNSRCQISFDFNGEAQPSR